MKLGTLFALAAFLAAAGVSHAQVLWQSSVVTSNYTGSDSDIKTMMIAGFALLGFRVRRRLGLVG